MCDLCTILCGPKSFSTRRFYSGGGISARASSWKVLNLDPWPAHGCGDTSEIKLPGNLLVHNLNCLNISIVKYLLFHISVDNVSLTTNKSNFNAGIYVNNDNIEHKSRIVTNFPTRDVPIRLTSPFIYDQFIYHILFSHPPSPIYPLISLIHCAFIYLYLLNSVFICFALSLFLYIMLYI